MKRDFIKIEITVDSTYEILMEGLVAAPGRARRHVLESGTDSKTFPRVHKFTYPWTFHEALVESTRISSTGAKMKREITEGTKIRE
jgi:hypothetical protein